jgi:hypothetical protein
LADVGRGGRLMYDELGGGMDTQTHADILLYGRSGAGKTYEAATAVHDPKDLFVISPDPTGHKSIPFKVAGKLIKSISDVAEVRDLFYEGGHGFKVLLFDGLPFINDMWVKEMGQYFVENMGSKDPDLMPIGGRMKILNQSRGMIRSFIDLTQVPNVNDRVHVIFTALEQTVGDEDDASVFSTRPLIGSKSMNQQFPAFFSSIGYIKPKSTGLDEKNQTVNQDRALLFAEVGGIMARDRLGIFPHYSYPAIKLRDYLYNMKGETNNG